MSEQMGNVDEITIKTKASTLESAVQSHPRMVNHFINYYHGLPDLAWFRALWSVLLYYALAFLVNILFPPIIFLGIALLDGKGEIRIYEYEMDYANAWLALSALLFIVLLKIIIIKGSWRLWRHPLSIRDQATRQKRTIEEYLSWGKLYGVLPVLTLVMTSVLLLAEVLALVSGMSLVIYDDVVRRATLFGYDDLDEIGAVIFVFIGMTSIFGLPVLMMPIAIYLSYIFKVMGRRLLKWCMWGVYLFLLLLMPNVVLFVYAVVVQSDLLLAISGMIFLILGGPLLLLFIVLSSQWLVFSFQLKLLIKHLESKYEEIEAKDEAGNERV